MLKNVVLPAPLGPIRLTIERSGMSKYTSLTAMRPPKTLVIPRASSMLLPFSSGTGSFHGFLFSLTLVQLFGALAVGDYGLRSQEHRSQDHAVDAPNAAQDDHTQDEDRDVEREARREDALYERAVERACDPPEDPPEGVGPKLRRHRVDAHRRGGGLVLAHRDPGPSQPGVPQAYVDVDRDQDQDQYRVVPRVQIQRPEPLPRVESIRQELEAGRVYSLDAYRPVGQVEAADVVPVLEEARDDLPESQGHYRQVVSPQPQGWRADDHAAQSGEEPGDDQEQPEGDVYPRRLPAGYALRSRAQREADLSEL